MADDPDKSVRLSRAELAMARGRYLQGLYPVVACTKEGFSICALGRRQTFRVTAEGERRRFEVEGEGIAEGGLHARGSKASFDAAPLTIPPPKPLDQARILEIARELDKRSAEDQRVLVQDSASAEEQARIGAENEAWITGLILEVGWVDADRFRRQTSDAAWLLVQHADSLPLLLAVADALDHRSSNHALMYDRVQIRLGKPQRYGTQIVFGANGKKGLFPLERPDQVDALRAGVGLPPLDGYLQRFGVVERTEIRCQ